MNFTSCGAFKQRNVTFLWRQKCFALRIFKRRRWTDVFAGRPLFLLTFSNTIVHLVQKGLLCHNAGQSLASYAGAVSPMMHGICITLLGGLGGGSRPTVKTVAGNQRKRVSPLDRSWTSVGMEKARGQSILRDMHLQPQPAPFEKFSSKVTCP